MTSSGEEDDEEGQRTQINDTDNNEISTQPDTSSERATVSDLDPDQQERYLQSESRKSHPSNATDTNWQQVKRVMNRLNSRRSRERQSCVMRQLQEEETRLRQENDALKTENKQIREILKKIRDLKSQMFATAPTTTNNQLGRGPSLYPPTTMGNFARMDPDSQQDHRVQLLSPQQSTTTPDPSHQAARPIHTGGQPVNYQATGPNENSGMATSLPQAMGPPTNPVNMMQYPLTVGFRPAIIYFPSFSGIPQFQPGMQMQAIMGPYRGGVQANQQVGMQSLQSQDVSSGANRHLSQGSDIMCQSESTAESKSETGVVPDIQPSGSTAGTTVDSNQSNDSSARISQDGAA